MHEVTMSDCLDVALSRGQFAVSAMFPNDDLADSAISSVNGIKNWAD
jgi:hypothetical protein